MSPISFDRAAEYYDTTRGYAAGSAERIRDAIVAYTKAGNHTRFLTPTTSNEKSIVS